MCPKHFSFILIWLLLVNCGSGPVGPEEAFVFPPKIYGSPEWDELSDEEQLQLLQVPEHVLSATPTSVLLQWQIAIPEELDFYNGYTQQHYERVTAGYNHIQELMHRENVIEEAYRIYRSIYPELINNKEQWVGMEKWYYLFPYIKIDLMLAQNEYLNNIEYERIDQLIALCLYIDHIKVESASPVQNRWSSLYPVIKLMIRHRNAIQIFDNVLKELEYLDYFIEKGRSAWLSDTEKIVAAANAYLPDWQEILEEFE